MRWATPVVHHTLAKSSPSAHITSDKAFGSTARQQLVSLRVCADEDAHNTSDFRSTSSKAPRAVLYCLRHFRILYVVLMCTPSSPWRRTVLLPCRFYVQEPKKTDRSVVEGPYHEKRKSKESNLRMAELFLTIVIITWIFSFIFSSRAALRQSLISDKTRMFLKSPVQIVPSRKAIFLKVRLLY